jgi:hypothetical protein
MSSGALQVGGRLRIGSSEGSSDDVEDAGQPRSLAAPLE